jgi:hypothetical protein
MAHPRITVALLAALAVASAGCRGEPPIAPVEGTVTKEGKPLAGVIVEFYPDPDFATGGPRSASELTDVAGHYRLRTDHGDNGAAVGRYRVCVLDTRALGAALHRLLRRDKDRSRLPKELTDKLPAPAAARLKPSFGRLNETPLRAEVRPDSQVIDLVVK